MKKIVALLFVIASVCLHSQETKYWEKIDFQFDSGIKFISIIQSDYYCGNGLFPFVVTTDSNSIYFFENHTKQGIKIINRNADRIKESHLIVNDDTCSFFYLTENKKLFICEKYNFNLNNLWYQEQIYDDETNLQVNVMLLNSNNEIVIYTEKYGAFIKSNFPYGKWKQINKGLENRKILELFGDNSFNDNQKYGLSDDKKVMRIEQNPILDSVEWVEEMDLSDFAEIRKVKFHGGCLIFLDANNKLNSIDNYHQTLNIADSIKITSFSVQSSNLCGLYYQPDNIPYEHNIIYGTEKHGIFFTNTYQGFLPYQLSEELKVSDITQIVPDQSINPHIVLIGNKNGEIYYGELELISIVENIKNVILTNISPQPASTKAMLRFTLPVESRVSVKLFNTLGMEQLAIADDFFSAGENSIPIDVSSLADGMYFVAIQYEGRTVVEKLVVRK